MTYAQRREASYKSIPTNRQRAERDCGMYDQTPSNQQVGGNHYKNMAIEPSEFIFKNDLNWLEGNAIKYICRHNAKGGKQDLNKAKHYIDLLIEWGYSDEASL